MENLLPWLNFGADNMNPELLEYWRTRGIEKHRHANAEDPDRTWFAYLPIHRTKPDKMCIRDRWDNGRTLALVPGADSFSRIDAPAKKRERAGDAR